MVDGSNTPTGDISAATKAAAEDLKKDNKAGVAVVGVGTVKSFEYVFNVATRPKASDRAPVTMNGTEPMTFWVKKDFSAV